MVYIVDDSVECDKPVNAADSPTKCYVSYNCWVDDAVVTPWCEASLKRGDRLT